ncbi:MAG: very short patch repair endonuclease [Nitrososphaerota archaeon]|jgi:DNA mismatch endonuclease (patch repair protein)|nr:very short patch repair endonuclease [Nitrososphaerota archaeon]
MADIFTKEKRSKIMSRIRGRNTKPEKIMRATLKADGYSYKLQYGVNHIDIAFPKEKVAVFIDGCFWHKCPRHFRMPKSGTAFWKKKINGNAARDRLTTKLIREGGWKVIRIWEHELRRGPERPARKVEAAVSRAGNV